MAEIAAAVGAFMAANASAVTAASMLISSGTAAAGFLGQQQAARDQQAANNAAAQSALAARNQQIALLERRGLEERDAASERMFDIRVDALEGEAAARARSAGRGVQGTTVDALANEYWQRAGRGEASVARTANNALTQLRAEREGAQANYETRLNSLPAVRRPSLAGLGLGIAGSLAGEARQSIRDERRREASLGGRE